MAKNKSPSPSLQLLTLTLLLLGFGLLMIYSASVAEALRDFGDKFYFVKLQLKWTLAGLLFLALGSRVNLKALEKVTPAIMLSGLILLFLVLIPGIGTQLQGARRWIVLPGFTLQPSELIKLIEILYLSTWLTSKKVTLTQFIAFLTIISGLILLQPDMGTTIVVVSIALSMYFLSNYPIINLLGLAVTGAIAGAFLIVASPYRAERLKTYFNPTSDPLGSSYHIRQILLALGSGGIFGVGVGRSRQKYEYLPETTTDSIFAIIGEELGFIGTIALIAAFLYLIYLIFKIAKNSHKPYKQVLVGGIGAWLALQVVLNLSSMVALTPLTGIPLPLVSYGGSSLVTMLAGIGIVINVARSEKI